MKQLYNVVLLAAFFAAQETVARAQDQNFACQVHGGSFVLDDTDFNALAESPSKLTRATFPSADPALRKKACDSRMMWRLIRDGKADPCHMTDKLYDWHSEFFAAGAETQKLTAWMVDAAFAGKKCP